MGNDLLTSDKIKINDDSSKKQTYNETRDNDDTVLNKSKSVGFSNYEDERKIVPENDRESDDSDVIFNNGTLSNIIRNSNEDRDEENYGCVVWKQICS